jgi:hypothetical protein
MLNNPQSHRITISMERFTVTANLQAAGTIRLVFLLHSSEPMQNEDVFREHRRLASGVPIFSARRVITVVQIEANIKLPSTA